MKATPVKLEKLLTSEQRFLRDFAQILLEREHPYTIKLYCIYPYPYAQHPPYSQYQIYSCIIYESKNRCLFYQLDLKEDRIHIHNPEKLPAQILNDWIYTVPSGKQLYNVLIKISKKKFNRKKWWFWKIKDNAIIDLNKLSSFNELGSWRYWTGEILAQWPKMYNSNHRSIEN